MNPLPATLLESLAAEAVREGLADAVYTRVKTPIGTLTVVSGEFGIVRLGFDGDPEDVLLAEVAAALGPRILKTDHELAHVREVLQEYLEGTRAGDLDLDYDLRLVRSPFRRTVLETLARDVHRGDVIKYGELAARAGNARAARAAGTACATNPVPLVVPCHRVLPAGGGVGSYGGGPPLKVRLLELEGARV
jgi:methylated-DNA-[protein]-cysteine S-methyltransferase